MGNEASRNWDAFISHASEDKADFVEPLATELQKYSLKIWFDKFTLQIGSSLRESIDEGLANSRFGIVVLSHHFFAKKWPTKELNALFSRLVAGPSGMLLPIWHGLTAEDVLTYSPLLSDIFAAKSGDGVTSVAKSVVKVIRPSAFRFDVSRRDAAGAVERMREHVKDFAPWLDARITLGPGQGILQIPKEKGIIVSSVIDGMKIDIIATDAEQYNKNPITFEVELSRGGADKLQSALSKREMIALGPSEFLSFSSPFFQLLHPTCSWDGEGQQLVIEPLSYTPVANKKFQLTLAFVLNNGEREEFTSVEFTALRSENGEMKLQSGSTQLPFTLNLTYNLFERFGKVRIQWRYSGFDIREVLKSDKAIGLFRRGGRLEVSGLGTEQFVPMAGGKFAPPSDAEEFRSAFIRQVYDIATRLDERISFPNDLSPEDLSKIRHLHEAVTTGRTTLPGGEIDLTITIKPGIDADSLLQQPVEMLATPPDPPEFATVLGKTFSLGPYAVHIKPRELNVTELEGQPDVRVLKIVLAEPLIYEFPQFISAVGPTS